MTFRNLSRALRTLLSRSDAERELDDELTFHVECETRKRIERGIDPIEARRQARAHFGSRAAVADDCRDERGTGGVEAIARDLGYAVRTWRRAPLAAVTIVLTVALGLALVTMAFSVYNAFFLRTDAVPRVGELFEVYRPAPPGKELAPPFTLEECEHFGRENAGFRAVAALDHAELRVDGRLASAAFVSGNFFDMVEVAAARGRALTPGDDRAGAAPVIVLSDRGWTKLFVRDPAVIGRTTRINGAVMEIAGVMPAGFRGLNIGTPDFWAPLASAPLVRPSTAQRMSDRPVEIIGRLRANVSRDAAEAGVREWAAGPGYRAVDGQPLHVRLRPRTGVSPDAGLEMLAFAVPLFFVFGLILLIACANVASLLLARGVARQSEIGVRLSLGATRRRLVRQLLTEGLVLGAAAAVLAYPLSRVLAAGVMAVIVGSTPPEFTEQFNVPLPEADWRLLPFLAAGAIATTVMFGLMPALQATRLDPVRTMRGELLQDGRPGRVRRLLMLGQVLAATLLLICAGIFLRGTLAASRSDAGVRVADTLVVSIGSESRRAAVLDALAGDPMVTMIGAASDPAEQPIAIRSVESGMVVPAIVQFVSANRFALLDVALVHGRGFSDGERTLDSAVVIVSANVTQALWPGRNPVGRTVRMTVTAPGDAATGEGTAAVPERTFTVVGVAPAPRRDASLAPRGADVYLPTTTGSAGTRVLVRVNEDPLKARTWLLDRLTRADPSLVSVLTFRWIFRKLETLLRVAFVVAVLLGGLALLLTVSGLFGVLSFLVQQRRKEIGVRMALGASTWAVAHAVMLESARPVLLGAAGGTILAAGAAGVLMTLPAAGVFTQLVDVLDPVAYAATLLFIVMACAFGAAAPAVAAARVNPTVALRNE